MLETNESEANDAGDAQVGGPVAVCDASKDATLLDQEVRPVLLFIFLHELVQNLSC